MVFYEPQPAFVTLDIDDTLFPADPYFDTKRSRPVAVILRPSGAEVRLICAGASRCAIFENAARKPASCSGATSSWSGHRGSISLYPFKNK
jgi:hypothetical protein